MVLGTSRAKAAGAAAKPAYNVLTASPGSNEPSRTEASLGTTARSQPVVNEAELALIERVCNGERELYYSLIQPYEKALFVAANSILRNEADAEDIAQEAALKGLKYLKSFRRESKFSTWLIQIAVNEARMKLRKDRRHLYDSIDDSQSNEEGDYIPRDFADWREIPSEALQRKELQKAIQKALDSLAPKYREVFVLRDVQKLNIQETAAALQITEASVKTRLLRARLQMRDALAPGIDGGWSNEEGTWKKVRPW
jgi:RNA polymerase sigma-70 factor, ECF subfamily